ncbi:MAG: hypothetical protein HQL03_10340 [Nitrospirae bacterium]|nr:hypothetical protein [Nitrospirota bacterium]
MIKTQFIEENGKPIAVIMDYQEYLRFKEIEEPGASWSEKEDRDDYYSAIETKLKNDEWIDHQDLKDRLDI